MIPSQMMITLNTSTSPDKPCTPWSHLPWSFMLSSIVDHSNNDTVRAEPVKKRLKKTHGCFTESNNHDDSNIATVTAAINAAAAAAAAATSVVSKPKKTVRFVVTEAAASRQPIKYPVSERFGTMGRDAKAIHSTALTTTNISDIDDNNVGDRWYQVSHFKQQHGCLVNKLKFLQSRMIFSLLYAPYFAAFLHSICFCFI
jgi:hypothetical protein